MNPLQKRLAALRCRSRFVITTRGGSRLIAVVLGLLCLAGFLDWKLHLPGLVRGVFLVGFLAAAGTLALRWLIRPLREPDDDLSLALTIEKAYPNLNDSLASAVQFLQEPERNDESAALRREAVRQTLREVKHYDFKGVVSAKGLGAAALAMLAGVAVAGVLLTFFPGDSRTALARLADPFGDLEWPTKTQLELDYSARMARGETFELRGKLAGIIPDNAVVIFDGLSPTRQTVNIRKQGDSAGTLLARVDRVENTFRFKVYANDVVSGPYEVDVKPPPVLMPFEGRPSPIVRLTYPEYTGFAAQNLPDGTGNIVPAPLTDPDAAQPVNGTRVSLRAAVDRPLARAWIEYRPDQPLTRQAAFTGLLGSEQPLSFMGALAAAQEVWNPVPARLGPDRKTLAVDFLPRLHGMYALRIEDETGLGNTRLFELKLLTDPAPTVNLDRPARTRDSLYLLPNAEITLKVSARDPQFAIRSSYLELRRRTSAGENDAPRRVMLYDHAGLERAVPVLAVALGGPLPLPTRPLKLRNKLIDVERRVALDSLGFPPLQEGDIITLQAFADDFDDVSVDKAPGHSHEVELLIVGRPTLEARLNDDQKRIEAALLRERKNQQEALDKIIAAEQHWRNTGRLKPAQGEKTDHLDQVFQAEQMQQQIRARIGNKENGLRADVERVLQAQADNKLPRSGAQDRMEIVAAELERLAREELPQIEPELTNARKADELAVDPKPPEKDEAGPLGAARAHQENVENTLGELSKLLEPWGSINSVKGETKDLLNEQRRLNEATRDLANPDTRGMRPEALTNEQRAALDAAGELQRKLGERVGQLLDKIERVARERAQLEPELAEALKEAAQTGRKGTVQEQLGEAGRNIRQNNLAEAERGQQAGLESLEEMVRALENRREQELDRLGKKIDEAKRELARLQEEQDKLRKKIKEAAKIADPEKRAAELKKLAGQQADLAKQAKELEQRLKFLKANRAEQNVANAAARMEQALRRLENGEDPGDDVEQQALDRLNDAQQDLEDRQEEVEEELAREKLAKVADQLKLLRQRQESIIKETERVQQRVERRKIWDRISLTNLGDLAESQRVLGRETDQVAEGKLAGATVFARILTKAADAMLEASRLIEEEREKVRDEPGRLKLDAEVLRLQREALRHFDHLVEALKEEQGLARQPAGNQGGQGPMGGGEQGGPRAPGDGIPELAQLKALRSLQNDVNERTADFTRKNPELDKLAPEAQRRLLQLRKDQEEIAELFNELTAGGEMP